MAVTYTFSPVTATDRAGLVWVSGILSLVFAVLTLATRFGIKHLGLGYDDWLILAATIVGLAQYIATFIGLSNGVGTSTTLLSRERAESLGAGLIAGEVLFVLALMLSKLSIVHFMKRLFTRDHKKAWWACNFAVLVSVVWGVGSALAVSVGCGPEHAIYGSERCEGKLVRWAVVVGLDALLEFFFFALAILLVFPLQMSLYIKITVVGAFSFRLICAVFAAMYGAAVGTYTRADDPGLAIATVLVWQQVELGYALMAATIPTLKSFIRGYNKAMGWEASYDSKKKLGGGYNLGTYGNNSAGRSAQMSKDRSRIREGQGDAMDLRPDEHDYRAGAYHEPGRGKSVRRRTSNAGSGDSEDPIIRRDVSVTVEHEPPRQTDGRLRP